MSVTHELKPLDMQIESLAQWLHDEVEWPEFDFPNHSWPDHPDDDGKRGNAYLRIVPRSSADQFREIARRILSALSTPTSAQERIEELENGGRALVRQLNAVIHRLNGQAYSSTLSELNAFRAALRDGGDSK
jgi:hypothetical protein